MKKLPLIVLFAATVGCGGSGVPDADNPLSGPPGCDQNAYTALLSSEIAQLVLACSQFQSLDDCPQTTKQPIQDAFKKKFEDWGKCNKEGAQ